MLPLQSPTNKGPRRAFKRSVGVLIAIAALGVSSGSARGDLIVTCIACGVAVPEGRPGELSWLISNNGASRVTLNDDIMTEDAQFVGVGPDLKDIPKLDAIQGCVQGAILVAHTGSCVLTITFTTPAAPHRDDGDRGFANLDGKNSLGNLISLSVDGVDATKTTILGQPLPGLVEVDDPHVPPTIPEPSIGLLLSSGLGFLALQWYRQRRT